MVNHVFLPAVLSVQNRSRLSVRGLTDNLANDYPQGLCGMDNTNPERGGQPRDVSFSVEVEALRARRARIQCRCAEAHGSKMCFDRAAAGRGQASVAWGFHPGGLECVLLKSDLPHLYITINQHLQDVCKHFFVTVCNACVSELSNILFIAKLSGVLSSADLINLGWVGRRAVLLSLPAEIVVSMTTRRACLRLRLISLNRRPLRRSIDDLA